ncbi:MAG TPA: PEP-CTERM sorting domain-containing protein, partial [Isosphaeraceae bacterium]|nr:PEP-CTERM sorting domain-containing protein [Isosphaeraceae bacterium]
LHADSVTVNSLIDASGGDGGYGGQTFMGRSAGGGGGGGGGQVFIMTAPGGFNMSGTIDVSGGAGGDANTDGFGTPGRGGLDGVIGVTTPYVPEPSSITLLVLGMAGVLAVGRSQYARRTLKDVRD